MRRAGPGAGPFASRFQKAFHNSDRGAAYAGHELSVLRQHLDAYAAGTLHFNTLMNVERSSQLEAPLMHQISAERTGRRSGRRIFPNFPRKHPASEDGVSVLDCEAIGHR